jgi:preprotein translocase subunit SecG
MVHAIVLVVHVFLAVAIIGLVLLQRGKGADAGAGFGAGASGTVFGARGSATALSKATAVLATLFFVTSLALAFLGGQTRTEEPTSILERAAQQPAPAPAEVPVPADATTQPPAAPATPGDAPPPTNP